MMESCGFANHDEKCGPPTYDPDQRSSRHGFTGQTIFLWPVRARRDSKQVERINRASALTADMKGNYPMRGVFPVGVGDGLAMVVEARRRAWLSPSRLACRVAFPRPCVSLSRRSLTRSLRAA